MTSDIRRTVQVKLELSDTAIETLSATIDQYIWAANYVVDRLWHDTDQPATLGRTEIHHRTYDELRDQTELHSGHVALAQHRAREVIASVTELARKGRTISKPRFTSEFLDFNAKVITFKDEAATLATIDSRVRVEFVIPECEETPHHQYLLNPEFDPGRCTFLTRDDECYLDVRLKRSPVEPFNPDEPGILGVDLGMSNLAVTSTGRFWSGDRVIHWRKECENRHRQLQQCGTRWARETLTSVNRRFRNRIDQYLHTVATELVEEALEHDCPVIAVEEISGIQALVQRRPYIRTWAYRQLIEAIRTNAETEGITVETVAPRYTSTRCSTCGFIERANRPSRDRFECTGCGYQNHADYNAAKNVGFACLRQLQNGPDGCALAGVRLNSGISTLDGQDRTADTGTYPC